ncbi:hypothetical protein BDZ97DRAFT_1813660 [Flammula alnicola]|nr:hypothetical protein BDZ97DRAFT_1813660 [Flammula alnicola]
MMRTSHLERARMPRAASSLKAQTTRSILVYSWCMPGGTAWTLVKNGKLMGMRFYIH